MTKNEFAYKRIEVTADQRQYLMRLFGVTSHMVMNACTWRRNSLLAKRIRKAALENGCQLVVIAPVVREILDKDGSSACVTASGTLLVANQEVEEEA